MKVAIFSDIHDNMDNLELCLKEIENRNITEAICLGDFIAPFIVMRIIESGIHTRAVWGNNDGEKTIITKFAMQSNGKFEISDTPFDELKIDNRKIFISHHDNGMASIARSGDYDAVFHGHTHKQYFEEFENGCILANPGEIYGNRTELSSFMIWDTEGNKAELIKIKE